MTDHNKKANSVSHLIDDELLEKIKAGKIWTFHGGVHAPDNKVQSSQFAIKDAGIPPFLIVSIEYKGEAAELLVKVGDLVLKGQPLTKAVGAFVVQHASSSGEVIAIEPRTDLHPSGLAVLSVVIKTDGLDRRIKCQRSTLSDLSRKEIIEATQDAGIIGLGGAGFPTHVKLARAQNIKLLIVNGAECEPYITSDDRLMQEYAHEILQGIEIAKIALNPQLTVIAIEDNKLAAIDALNQAILQDKKTDIIVRKIPTMYPSGSAKQLIKILTGKQTPIGKHANALGIVMLNVGTLVAMKEAIVDGTPLISRIVTLTGDAFKKKGNFSVRLGTPIQYLLDKYEFHAQKTGQKLIIGGPMMGFTLAHSQIPVTKICNCILAPNAKEMPLEKEEVACIRCSDCAQVCPSHLLPQQLLWYSKSQDHDKLKEYNLSACIECGACAYVCPSQIPLVQYYRIAKSEIWANEEEAKKIEIARQRHEHRDARLEQAKLARKEKHKAAAEKRQKQLKEKNGGEDLIAAALARAKAKKADNLAQASDSVSPAPVKKKNDAVAAAIARAKAKKAANARAAEPTDALPENDDVIKARTARKEKARLHKLEKTQKITPSTNDATNALTLTPAEKRKAKIAAAIAKAKAKKEKDKD